MSHADEVIKLPKNFKVVAKSSNSKLCIVENTKRIYMEFNFIQK